MKKIAIILSGCGVFDGSEIHEATLAMLAVKQAGCTYEIYAPDKEQADVVNHYTGEAMPEKRNVLVESARIARKNAKPLGELNAANYDAIVLPGGFGAAKNLCNFAFEGENYTVIPELEKVLLKANELNKPIGAMCIAPVILAKVFKGSKVTVGQPCDASAAIEKTGSQHVNTTHAQTVTDEKYKLVTTPCYMLDADIAQIYQGATNLIKELLKLM